MLTNFFKFKTSYSDFQEKADFLIKKLKDKKVVFYGIGDELEQYLNKYNFKSLNIVSLCDKNIKENEEFYGIKAIGSNQLKDLSFDYILIAQDNLWRAKRFLEEELGVDKNKIIDLLRDETFDYEINSNYLKKIKFKKQLNKLSKKFKNKKIVVYGANSLFKAAKDNYDFSKLNIIAICDMKFKMRKNGEKYCGISVCAPYEIKNYNPDYVLVFEKYLPLEIMELLYFTSLKNSEIKIISALKKPLIKTISEILSENKPPKVIPSKTKYKRIANFLFNRYTSKFKYNTYAPYEIPTSARIDACSICQLHCSECFMTKYDHSAIGDGWLKFSDFKKFVDENPNIRQISLSNNGEVFLNPELVPILEYAYKKNVKLDAFTGVNLNTLSDEVAEALVKYQFDFMYLSIDGASQETYSKYRQKGDFNKVIENIKKINSYKKQYNSEFPKMGWKFILFNHNEHEIVKAKEIAKSLNIPIAFNLPWGDNTFKPADPEFVKKETGFQFASVTESQEKTKKKRRLNLCQRAFSAPQINYNGILLGCCILFREHYGVNVFEQGFENALNSAEFQSSIRIIRGEFPPIFDNPCTYCNEYDAITVNNQYFE